MQFTPREIKMIERLRTQQRQWPTWRFLNLFNALLLSGLCAFVLCMYIQHFREVSRIREAIRPTLEELPSDQLARHILETVSMVSDQAVEVALFFPIWLIFALQALFHFLMVALHWHGRVDRVLLLKLIDAEQGKTVSDTPGTSS